jgi:hypothetical protein
LKIAHIQESQKAPHDQPLTPSGKALAGRLAGWGGTDVLAATWVCCAPQWGQA